jgi:hypothetical protein
MKKANCPNSVTGLVERAQHGGGAERQADGIFHVHQASAIGLVEHQAGLETIATNCQDDPN